VFITTGSKEEEDYTTVIGAFILCVQGSQSFVVFSLSTKIDAIDANHNKRLPSLL